jgi:hypothetical protein
VPDGLGDLQLLDIEVADTDEADLALVPQPRQRAPALFDLTAVIVRGRPVDLQQVDGLGPQTMAGLLDLPTDGLGA